MKLFTRYSLFNLIINVFIFVIASVVFYFSLHYILVEQIDEDLEIEEAEVVGFVQKNKQLPDIFTTAEQILRFTAVAADSGRHFETILMLDTSENRLEDYRRLTFPINVQNKNYRVEVLKSLESSNDLLYSILTITIATILAILLITLLLNRYLLKKLWTPFYESLDLIKNYSVSAGNTIQFPETTIAEFNFMNDSLKELTQLSRSEYLALKTFSENAAHEIQTPIAIIRSKLDLLLQEESLSEKGSRTLITSFNALERLSRLSRSLLLLTKIENNQFEEQDTINLTKRITERIEDFHELWMAKNITIVAGINEVIIKVNRELLDILLTNLLSNATIHNYENGRIEVALSSASLTIKNTARSKALDSTRIFQRFYKPSMAESTNGLGLSIIKEISDVSGFTLHYSYQNDMHQFCVAFAADA